MKLPFIIIVDDDEQVLRAIQRDMRNEYRDAYRVSAGESAVEVLELVKELKLKNRMTERSCSYIVLLMIMMTRITIIKQKLP